MLQTPSKSKSHKPIHRAFIPPVSAKQAVLPGARLLKLRVRNALELERALERGLSTGSLEALREATNLNLETLAAIAQISYESLNRYRKSAKPLPAQSSARLYEFARVFERTLEVIPDREQAQAWLHEPGAAFAGRSPLETLASSLGAERVMRILERLEDGVYS